MLALVTQTAKRPTAGCRSLAPGDEHLPNNPSPCKPRSRAHSTPPPSPPPTNSSLSIRTDREAAIAPLSPHPCQHHAPIQDKEADKSTDSKDHYGALPLPCCKRTSAISSYLYHHERRHGGVTWLLSRLSLRAQPFIPSEPS
jgi:hypothetical protein